MRPGGHLGYVGVFHDAEPSLSPTFRTTRVPPHSQTVAVVGDGAVGLLAVLAAKQLGAEPPAGARWLDDTDN